MFVVLDGTLALWRDRGGERIDLRRATRGDLAGHVGFFLERHPATFEALSDARLLRFEDVDLELMMRRYPRIAARLLWNLNHSQASLMTGATRPPPEEPPALTGRPTAR
jgi:CRP-like cAMP-binding protein